MLNKLLFLLIISCSVLFAHSLKVFAKTESDKIEIKSYYYGGSACKGCDVELRGENGEVLSSAKTDEKGEASLSLPNKTSFKIAVIAGGGHMKEIAYKNTSETNATQNATNSQSSNAESSSVFVEFLKCFGSILLIFVIFGLIYFAKKKR